MTETLPAITRTACCDGPDAPVSAYSSLVRIDVSALSHPGHIRANNEDQFFVTRLARSLRDDAEQPAAWRRARARG